MVESYKKLNIKELVKRLISGDDCEDIVLLIDKKDFNSVEFAKSVGGLIHIESKLLGSFTKNKSGYESLMGFFSRFSDDVLKDVFIQKMLISGGLPTFEWLGSRNIIFSDYESIKSFLYSQRIYDDFVLTEELFDSICSKLRVNGNFFQKLISVLYCIVDSKEIKSRYFLNVLIESMKFEKGSGVDSVIGFSNKDNLKKSVLDSVNGFMLNAFISNLEVDEKLILDGSIFNQGGPSIMTNLWFLNIISDKCNKYNILSLNEDNVKILQKFDSFNCLTSVEVFDILMKDLEFIANNNEMISLDSFGKTLDCYLKIMEFLHPEVIKDLMVKDYGGSNFDRLLSEFFPLYERPDVNGVDRRVEMFSGSDLKLNLLGHTNDFYKTFMGESIILKDNVIVDLFNGENNYIFNYIPKRLLLDKKVISGGFKSFLPLIYMNAIEKYDLWSELLTVENITDRNLTAVLNSCGENLAKKVLNCLISNELLLNRYIDSNPSYLYDFLCKFFNNDKDLLVKLYKFCNIEIEYNDCSKDIQELLLSKGVKSIAVLSDLIDLELEKERLVLKNNFQKKRCARL